MRPPFPSPQTFKFVTGNATPSAEDQYLVVDAGWAGGLITLPGPSTGGQPVQGETYEVMDPASLVTNTHKIQFSGGGVPIFGQGVGGTFTTPVSVTTQYSAPGGMPCAKFTYCQGGPGDAGNAGNPYWIMCGGPLT